MLLQGEASEQSPSPSKRAGKENFRAGISKHKSPQAGSILGFLGTWKKCICTGGLLREQGPELAKFCF
jgi:hypothetical protein